MNSLCVPVFNKGLIYEYVYVFKCPIKVYGFPVSCKGLINNIIYLGVPVSYKGLIYENIEMPKCYIKI